MNHKDGRWKQRFQNFEIAFNSLKEALEIPNPDKVHKARIVQIYEYTFELAWKTLKDFLEKNQVIASFPREVIKEGFAFEMIENGDLWLDMLEKRNLMSHTYDQKKADVALNLIRNEYYSEIQKLVLKLKSLI